MYFFNCLKFCNWRYCTHAIHSGGQIWTIELQCARSGIIGYQLFMFIITYYYKNTKLDLITKIYLVEIQLYNKGWQPYNMMRYFTSSLLAPTVFSSL